MSSQPPSVPAQNDARLLSSRRALLHGAAGLTGVVGVGAFAVCSDQQGSCSAVSPSDTAVRNTEEPGAGAGQRIVSARLDPRPVILDLGGRTVDTLAYGDSIPGPLLRAPAGDLLRVEVTNGLDTGTSARWHGVAPRNDVDGSRASLETPYPGVDSDDSRGLRAHGNDHGLRRLLCACQGGQCVHERLCPDDSGQRSRNEQLVVPMKETG